MRGVLQTTIARSGIGGGNIWETPSGFFLCINEARYIDYQLKGARLWPGSILWELGLSRKAPCSHIYAGKGASPMIGRMLYLSCHFLSLSSSQRSSDRSSCSLVFW